MYVFDYSRYYIIIIFIINIIINIIITIRDLQSYTW